MAHSSYRANITCPICHHTQATKLGSSTTGLVKCQHCQACLVVSWSGHYVRDPFVYKHFVSLRAFRHRQSLPQPAHRRTSKFNRPLVVIVFGSLILSGIALSNLAGILPASMMNELGKLRWLRESEDVIQQSH